MGSGQQSLALERDGPALGAPQDRARQLERGAGPGLARDHEFAGHHDPTLEVLEQHGRSGDHLGRDAGAAVFEPSPGIGRRGQLGPDDEQLALDPQDDRADLGQRRVQHAVLVLRAELGSCQPERRDGLVDRAIGLGPRIVLLDPRPAEQEAGRTVVTAAGRDDRVDRRRGRLASGAVAGHRSRTDPPVTT